MLFSELNVLYVQRHESKRRSSMRWSCTYYYNNNRICCFLVCLCFWSTNTLQSLTTHISISYSADVITNKGQPVRVLHGPRTYLVFLVCDILGLWHYRGVTFPGCHVYDIHCLLYSWFMTWPLISNCKMLLFQILDSNILFQSKWDPPPSPIIA